MTGPQYLIVKNTWEVKRESKHRTAPQIPKSVAVLSFLRERKVSRASTLASTVRKLQVFKIPWFSLGALMRLDVMVRFCECANAYSPALVF